MSTVLEAKPPINIPKVYTLRYSLDYLRGIPPHIMRVWIKRHVENGDQVTVYKDKNDIVMECPDCLLELYVGQLCEIVHERGFAAPLFHPITE